MLDAIHSFLVSLRNSLDALSPGGFNAALALLLMGGIWLWRKLSPASFDKLPSTLQAWPALTLGAALSALSSGGAQSAISVLGGAFTGLLSGLTAIGTHHVLKESPMPYNGGRKSAELPPLPTPPLATTPPKEGDPKTPVF